MESDAYKYTLNALIFVIVKRISNDSVYSSVKNKNKKNSKGIRMDEENSM